MKALIIDDNKNNIDLLCEMLQVEDFICNIIIDSRIVPSYLQDNIPADVVFLDLEMPHLDGYEILELFQSNELWHQVPVVACTVHVTEMQQSRSKGFHSFLAKPLDIEKFPQQLLEILNGNAVWDIGR